MPVKAGEDPLIGIQPPLSPEAPVGDSEATLLASIDGDSVSSLDSDCLNEVIHQEIIVFDTSDLFVPELDFLDQLPLNASAEASGLSVQAPLSPSGSIAAAASRGVASGLPSGLNRAQISGDHSGPFSDPILIHDLNSGPNSAPNSALVIGQPSASLDGAPSEPTLDASSISVTPEPLPCAPTMATPTAASTPLAGITAIKPPQFVGVPTNSSFKIPLKEPTLILNRVDSGLKGVGRGGWSRWSKRPWLQLAIQALL